MYTVGRPLKLLLESTHIIFFPKKEWQRKILISQTKIVLEVLIRNT